MGVFDYESHRRKRELLHVARFLSSGRYRWRLASTLAIQADIRGRIWYAVIPPNKGSKERGVVALERVTASGKGDESENR